MGGSQGVAALAEIACSEQEGVHIVAVAGEVDVSNVRAVEEAAHEISNQALGVVLDLSRATYIDSSTVSFLFRLRRGLRRRGQALRVVCAPGSSAWRVLELTGFERKLPLLDDRNAAVAAIREDVSLGDHATLMDEKPSEQP